MNIPADHKKVGVPKEATRRGRVLGRIRRFFRAESGVAAVYFVLSAPVWIGGLALGAEVGSWYYYQQRLQSTADTVAYSIAGRAGTGALQNELQDLAQYNLQREKFDFSKGEFNFSISPTPTSSPNGPVFKDGTVVTVSVTRTVPRLLTSFFEGTGDFTLSAQASAQVSMVKQGCILALKKSGNGTLSVNPVSHGSISVTNCEVLSNSVDSGFSLASGSQLTTDCARSAGSFAYNGGTLNVSCAGGPFEAAGFTLDPYAEWQEPDLTGVTCNNHTSVTITPTQWQTIDIKTLPDGKKYAWFCDGAVLEISRTMSLSIGSSGAMFIFDNATFRIRDGGAISSFGVTYYFLNGGHPEIYAPNTQQKFLPPDSGPRAGMLFVGARANTGVANNQIVVGPGSFLSGIVYFPASRVFFRTSGSAGGSCPQIVANTVTIDGTWAIDKPCDTAGYRPIIASRAVKLTH